MIYRRGDIVKIDIGIQQIIDPYEVVCPYVEVVTEWDEDGDSPNMWAFGTLKNTRTGSILTRVEYFFKPEGSLLWVEAVNG